MKPTHLTAGDLAAHSAAETVQGFAGGSPALAAAVRRLCTQRLQGAGRGDDASQPQGPGAGSAGKQLELTLQMALQATLCTLRTSNPPEQPSLPYLGSHAARHVARYIMPMPSLLQVLPSAARAQLTALPVFNATMCKLQQLSSGQDAPRGAMPWQDCLWALANITGLAAGSLTSTALQVSSFGTLSELCVCHGHGR
jgi:hypothetical protein